MPVISYIPKSYREGFRVLASLKREDFVALQGALSSATLCSSTDALAANVINSETIGISNEIEQILSSVGGLVSFLENDNDIEEIISDIAFLGKTEQLIKEEDTKNFQERLFSLLQNDKIFYASKAKELINETQNLYLSSRIVTDFRPIFSLKIEESPKVGMITHNLHIHYQGTHTGLHQDIYITLDSADVSSLIEILVRAQKKEESLQTILTATGITNINE